MDKLVTVFSFARNAAPGSSGAMLGIQRRRGRAFLILIALPATAMGFALSVQISVLSWILATRYGLDIHEIGLVWAAGPIAGILGQVMVGVVSDRVWFWGGRRRPFIIIGGGIAAAMILALPELGLISAALGLESVIGVAIAVALALDLAVNVGFDPTRALIADVTAPGAERSRGYGWMQTVSGSFGVLAYAIGALLGNMVLIWFAVGFVLLLSVAPALLVEEPRPQVSEGAHEAIDWPPLIGALSPLWAILIYDLYALGIRLAGAAPTGFAAELLCALATTALVAHALLAPGGPLVEFRKLIAAHALSWVGVQSLFIYLVSFLQQRMPGLDADALGRTTALAYLALNGVAALAPALLLAPLTRRRRRVHVHSAAVALMTAAFAGIWLAADTPATLYALMALAGIGWGAIVSLPFAILSERVGAARMGLFMGLFNLAVVLPQLVASFGIGAFAARIDDKGLIFAIGGLFLALSALAWLFVKPLDNQRATV